MAGIELDRVHDLRAGPSGGLRAEADLDRLDRLDAHHGGGQTGVELAVVLDVTPQAHRAALDDRLDDPAEGVAGLLGRVYGRDDRGVGLRIQRVDGAGVANRKVEAQRRRSDPAQLGDVADHLDPHRAEQQPGQRPDRNAERRFAALARSRTWRMPVW